VIHDTEAVAFVGNGFCAPASKGCGAQNKPGQAIVQGDEMYFLNYFAHMQREEF